MDFPAPIRFLSFVAKSTITNLSTISAAAGYKYYSLLWSDPIAQNKYSLYFFSCWRMKMVRIYMLCTKVEDYFFLFLFLSLFHGVGPLDLLHYFTRSFERQTLDNQEHYIVSFWIFEHVIQRLRLATSWAVGHTASSAGTGTSYFCLSGLLYTGAAPCLKTCKLIS